MAAAESPLLMRWSTDSVAAPRRLDYFVGMLENAVIPMTVHGVGAKEFASHITAAPLGQMALLRIGGTAHDSIRGEHELARSSERSLHLITSLSCAWDLDHRGAIHLEPGDLVLTDSQYAHHLGIRANYDFIHLKIPPEWVRAWSPHIMPLIGRKIAADSRWGRALSGYVGQLTPEFVGRSPVPESVLVDHIGALLALHASEVAGTRAGGELEERAGPGAAARSLLERIGDCLAQRCTEPQLSAAEVAATLGISPRTLHRALAASGETFGDRLFGARSRVAIRMLESRLFDRVAIAEVGRRAGFTDASHFARVLKRRSGRTPLQIRAARDAAPKHTADAPDGRE